MTPVTDLISQVGFPVVMTMLMLALYREERRDRQEERQELRDERRRFRKAIDSQTEAFEALARSVAPERADDVLTDGGERTDDTEEGSP
ncbi:hypothetical protein [Halostella salina]|uniref:hypothetical protein n=1 Tax=Halostella salina TaxID=1547897 RepID=UPI000EF838D4|nr:hypothetical protein [Halostella salina]